ncbi:MAG: hypothetical protein JST81_14525 [Bacteroidetes bacterium]|nr:hypothetical protein [Bacteroidota bacterium]
MNYIRHLNAFFSFVRCDKRLTCSHVSLYMALFQCWNINRFKNPFTISREETMKLSAIGSKNTYHKNLKELHDFGYIFYKASLNKFFKSSVHIVVFDNPNPVNIHQLNLFVSGAEKNEKKQEVTCPKLVQDEENVGPKNDTVPVPILTDASPIFDTVPVSKMGLLIKHKHINSKQERETNSLTQNIFSKNRNLQEGINELAAAPKNGTPSPGSSTTKMEKPTLQQVSDFFADCSYPATEAHKFFNHYQSIGWLVAGKIPMTDWKSSANKWMINAVNFQMCLKVIDGNHQQSNLDTRTDKDYSQPL